MPVGKDQLAGPSARYMVVGVYTFPVDLRGQPLVTPWGEGGEMDQEIPADLVEESLEGEAPEVLVEDEEPEMCMSEEQQRRAKSTRDTWDRLVQESKDVATQSVTLVEVVADRTVGQVLHALARMHARLRQLGLPIYRLHGDKAKELVSHQAHRWAGDRQMVVTHISGTRSKATAELNRKWAW